MASPGSPQFTRQLADALWALPPAQLVDHYQYHFDSDAPATPVLICARNEAHDLPATLASLAESWRAAPPSAVVTIARSLTTAKLAARWVVKGKAGRKTGTATLKLRAHGNWSGA